jgi:hypothetical protein
MTHVKIMEKASKALAKDAKHYESEEKHDKGIKKKHDKIEHREALSAAQALKKRAKKSHEY